MRVQGAAGSRVYPPARCAGAGRDDGVRRAGARHVVSTRSRARGLQHRNDWWAGSTAAMRLAPANAGTSRTTLAPYSPWPTTARARRSPKAPATDGPRPAAALVRAHEHASQEWMRSIRTAQAASQPRATPVTADVLVRCGLARIASAAAAVSLLGGNEHQRASAIAFARRESAIERSGAAPGLDRHERWRLGDATGRGVRLALLALADRTSTLGPPAVVGDEGMLQSGDVAESG